MALFKIIKKNVEIDTFNTQLSIDFALMLNKMTRFYYIPFHPQRYTVGWTMAIAIGLRIYGQVIVIVERRHSV